MIPFSKRENDDGQYILIVAPSGYGKNILLLNLIKEHLPEEYIILVSDSAKMSVNKNNIWYDGPIFETKDLVKLLTSLFDNNYIEPIYVVIDDPTMEHATIKYLSQIVKKLRHTKISVIMLFQQFTTEISPAIRCNARLIYFSSMCGRPLLELIYPPLDLDEKEQEFIKSVHKLKEKYRFIFREKENNIICHFKPELITYRYKFDPKRKLKRANQNDKKNSPK